MKKCSICKCKIEEENGDILGYFGIIEVAFCVWCLSSITDMVIQLEDLDNIETLKIKIIELQK